MAGTRTVALTATGIVAVVAAAVIGATAGSNQADRTDRADRADQAATGLSSGATATPSTSDSEATSGRGRSPSADQASGTSDPRSGSEILPTPAGDPSTPATGYSLPPLPSITAAPLLGATLPKSAVAKGRLVVGFPEALAPPAGTSVESSSVAAAREVLQAALVATGGDPRAVVDHYRTLLTARGFTEQHAQGVQNAPAAAFARGRDNVTVTTHDGKAYLIANLRAKGATR